MVDDELRSKSMGFVCLKRYVCIWKVLRFEWWDVDEYELGGFDVVGEVGL